jgi:hypothetical protein
MTEKSERYRNVAGDSRNESKPAGSHAALEREDTIEE